MLRKHSSALSTKRLRSFIKRASLSYNMNTHASGSVANQIYSQLAAAPKTNNRVPAAFPVTPAVLPPPPPAGSFNRTSFINMY